MAETNSGWIVFQAKHITPCAYGEFVIAEAPIRFDITVINLDFGCSFLFTSLVRFTHFHFNFFLWLSLKGKLHINGKGVGWVEVNWITILDLEILGPIDSKSTVSPLEEITVTSSCRRGFFIFCFR